MRKGYIFSKEKNSYSDYLKTMQELIEEKPFVVTRNNMLLGIDAIVKINDEKARQKLVESSVIVDRELTPAYTRDKNTYHKLPIMMTLASIVGNHNEKVQNLNADQLALVGHFCYVVKDEEMDEYLDLLSMNVLQSVISKTADRKEQLDILSVIEDKYFEFYIDKDESISLNSLQVQMINFVNQSSKEEILTMVKPINVLFRELEEQGYSI